MFGHYATGCFVAFLGDISTLRSGWNMKQLFCCPALELFHCLHLWKTVRLHGKKLQNATNYISVWTSKEEIKYTKAKKIAKSLLSYIYCERNWSDQGKIDKRLSGSHCNGVQFPFQEIIKSTLTLDTNTQCVLK